MAFKREGDDKSLLNILQKRRISELLVNDIPEEESLLLSNGRFACTVCSYRPIFDTVSMLVVHRKGKKHAYYMERKLEKDLDYKTSIEKRQHEQWLKSGEVAVTEMTSRIPKKHHSLLTSCEYNARMSKLKPKPYGRRPILDIDSKDSSTSSSSCAKMAEYKDSKISLFLENGKLKKEAPLTISDFRKAVGLHKEPIHVKPYRGPGSTSATSENTTTQTISHCSLTRASTSKQHEMQTPGIKSVKQENVVYVHPKYHKSESKKHKHHMGVTKTAVEQEKINVAEKYLAFREAGWKKDLDGNWVKDEDCEFDSDEEPPNLP